MTEGRNELSNKARKSPNAARSEREMMSAMYSIDRVLDSLARSDCIAAI